MRSRQWAVGCRQWASGIEHEETEQTERVVEGIHWPADREGLGQPGELLTEQSTSTTLAGGWGMARVCRVISFVDALRYEVTI